MTPAEIEPATFRFVAQHLNHCVTVVPHHGEHRDKLTYLYQSSFISKSYIRFSVS